MINLKRIRKADLHVHLNGLVSNNVFRKLLKPYKKELPDWFNINTDMVLQNSVNSLSEYLKPWYGFKMLPRNEKECRTMIDSALKNLSQENIVYAEIRNSPFNIAALSSQSLEYVLNSLCDILQEGNEKHQLDARLIVSLSRYKLTYEKANALLNAIKNVNRTDMIVGIDISGNEEEQIDSRIAVLVKKAKDTMGIGVTIHAGETGNAKNIEWAINECHADRISHACALQSEPKLVEIILEKNICIESCISSNILSGTVPTLEAHPITFFMEKQIPVVICTDNPSVHNKTLTDEYYLFNKLTNNTEYLNNMYSIAKNYSFGG